MALRNRLLDISLARLLGMLLLCCLGSGVTAQTRASPGIDWNVPIRASAHTPEPRALLRPIGTPDPHRRNDSGGTAVSWNLLPAGISAQIVEFRQPQIAGGVPQRPKRGLAFESTGMRALVNQIGLEATRCQAPVVRMHTKLRGKFASTAWVYARCSLR